MGETIRVDEDAAAGLVSGLREDAAAVLLDAQGVDQSALRAGDAAVSAPFWGEVDGAATASHGRAARVSAYLEAAGGAVSDAAVVLLAADEGVAHGWWGVAAGLGAAGGAARVVAK